MMKTLPYFCISSRIFNSLSLLPYLNRIFFLNCRPMEMTSIVLPSALTAANSKKLLSSCRSALTKGELHLDGSSLTSMDYSADAFFALLAELSEKTGNALTLAHFNADIKAHLSALRKMEPPARPAKRSARPIGPMWKPSRPGTRSCTRLPISPSWRTACSRARPSATSSPAARRSSRTPI